MRTQFSNNQPSVLLIIKKLLKIFDIKSLIIISKSLIVLFFIKDQLIYQMFTG